MHHDKSRGQSLNRNGPTSGPAERRDALAPHGGGEKCHAFTRVELLAVLGVLALLAALAVPALASTRFRSQQIVCLNNLAQIGRAFAMWGTDHGNRPPLTMPWWEGGTSLPTQPPGRTPPPGATPPIWFALGIYQNAWFQFWWVSNELATPKVLACPSDSGKRAAADFSSSTNGGFLSPSFRNNSVSYTLTHSFAEDGRLVFIADRTFSGSSATGGGSCAYGITYNKVARPGDPLLRWIDGSHPDSGNLLFTDGSVEQTDNAGLKEAMGRFAIEDGSGLGLSGGEGHFIAP